MGYSAKASVKPTGSTAEAFASVLPRQMTRILMLLPVFLHHKLREKATSSQQAKRQSFFSLISSFCMHARREYRAYTPFNNSYLVDHTTTPSPLTRNTEIFRNYPPPSILGGCDSVRSRYATHLSCNELFSITDSCAITKVLYAVV